MNCEITICEAPVKQQKKRGRKKMNEDERRKRRLFQNRASALKCRRKKKEQYNNMECEVTKANRKIDFLLEVSGRQSYEISEKDKIIQFLLHKVAICESLHTGQTEQVDQGCPNGSQDEGLIYPGISTQSINSVVLNSLFTPLLNNSVNDMMQQYCLGCNDNSTSLSEVNSQSYSQAMQSLVSSSPFAKSAVESFAETFPGQFKGFGLEYQAYH